MIKNTISTIFFHLIICLSASAEALKYEVIADLDDSSGSAKISNTGDVVIERKYAGKKNGSTIIYKNKGAPTKMIDANPGEELSPIGFLPSGEIVAISTIDVNTKSFVILNPNTLERKTLSLEDNIVEALGSDSFFVNESGLTAIVHGSTDEKTVVSFITSSLEIKSVEIAGSYALPENGMSGLSSEGKVFVKTSDYKTDTSTYYKVSMDGTAENLGSDLFGSDASAFANTNGNYLSSVDGHDSSSLKFTTYNMLSGLLTSGEGSLKPQDAPSYENSFYTSSLLLDNNGAIYSSGSSVGFSDTFYLGSTTLRINPDGRVEHLNCFVDPSLGHISEVLQINNQGEILASVSGPDGSSKAVVFQPADTSALTNYCLNVEASVNKACKGNLKGRSRAIARDGYTDAINLNDPKGECKLKLKFTDSSNNPVAKRKVVLRNAGKKAVFSSRTNLQGEAEIDLKKALVRREACGWSVFLEDFANYQPNGIVIFREQSHSCRRI